MKHAEVNQGVLRGYLDGELDSGRLSAVEQHLKSCRCVLRRARHPA